MIISAEPGFGKSTLILRSLEALGCETDCVGFVCLRLRTAAAPQAVQTPSQRRQDEVRVRKGSSFSFLLFDAARFFGWSQNLREAGLIRSSADLLFLEEREDGNLYACGAECDRFLGRADLYAEYFAREILLPPPSAGEEAKRRFAEVILQILERLALGQNKSPKSAARCGRPEGGSAGLPGGEGAEPLRREILLLDETGGVEAEDPRFVPALRKLFARYSEPRILVLKSSAHRRALSGETGRGNTAARRELERWATAEARNGGAFRHEPPEGESEAERQRARQRLYERLLFTLRAGEEEQGL